MFAGPTAPFRNQAGCAPVLQTGQQPKDLPPLQAEQFAGVCDTQTARPNAQQNFEPIEFLLAHRHHRHRAPPRPLEPRAVSRQLCRGVSSLYCGYSWCRITLIMERSRPVMDVYHIWFNLKEGVSDIEFAENVNNYLDHLKSMGAVVRYRITRRKLGLGPPQLPQWHITIDFENLAQMDVAFGQVASRADPVESF